MYCGLPQCLTLLLEWQRGPPRSAKIYQPYGVFGLLLVPGLNSSFWYDMRPDKSLYIMNDGNSTEYASISGHEFNAWVQRRCTSVPSVARRDLLILFLGLEIIQWAGGLVFLDVYISPAVPNEL